MLITQFFEWYLAEGCAITSIRLSVPAGSDLRYCFSPSALRWEGLLLIQMVTSAPPRYLILPSASTSTPGAFCSASVALPLCTLGSSLTL